MKLKSILNVLKREKGSPVINLEYLIIYQDSGQPIYSKCWGSICGLLGTKDELLTAFLAAVSSMPGMFAESDTKVHSMSIGSLMLLFRYSTSENIICAAFKEGDVNEDSMVIINNLFTDISRLLDEGYQDTPWDRLNNPKVKSFVKELLQNIIYPWSHVASPTLTDIHEEDCPLCMPKIIGKDEKLPVWGSIKNLYSTKTKSLDKVETDNGSLKIGDPAPAFIAQTDEGKTIKLSDYQNKTNLVLFFYPKANTPGCIIEAQSFKEAYNELKDQAIEIIGISVDNKADLQAFRNDQDLPFPLIADTTKDISAKYGCLNESGMANRTTFLIDDQGKIRKIWRLTGAYAQAKLSQHASDVRKSFTKLVS